MTIDTNKQKPCPGSKIRSGGKGRGLGTGKGRGPINKSTSRRQLTRTK